jgi:FKBP-type peptidyl-prolyl cis-trans isomerase
VNGVQCVVLEEGPADSAAQRPAGTDRVRVRYAGYLESGQQYDATAEGGDIDFRVTEVIPGWAEALATMSPGDRCKFLIPSQLAYGERGYGGRIPPRANLVLDVELLEIIPGPPPLPVPEFLLPPTSELTTTPSGLQYKVLRAGTGPKPVTSDIVTVHHAGWLTDGTPFDNSYDDGEPVTFPLTKVIAGWTEGLQLMPVGSLYLFVVPSQLAYGPVGRGGVIPPDAPLVYQVELVKLVGP